MRVVRRSATNATAFGCRALSSCPRSAWVQSGSTLCVAFVPERSTQSVSIASGCEKYNAMVVSPRERGRWWRTQTGSSRFGPLSVGRRATPAAASDRTDRSDQSDRTRRPAWAASCAVALSLSKARSTPSTAVDRQGESARRDPVVGKVSSCPVCVESSRVTRRTSRPQSSCHPGRGSRQR